MKSFKPKTSMWKKNSVILLFILCLGHHISGQENLHSFTLGIRGGIVASQVAGDGYGGFDKLGFFFGTTIDRKFAKNNGFEIGLQFINKGSRKNIQADKGDFISYKLSLSYVEMPILYKFYQRNFVYGIGIAPEFLINTKEIDNDGIELDSRSTFNDISIGLLVNMDYQIKTNSFLSFRFTNSLTPIRNGVALDTNQLNFWRKVFNKGQYNTLVEIGFKQLIGQ